MKQGPHAMLWFGVEADIEGTNILQRLRACTSESTEGMTPKELVAAYLAQPKCKGVSYYLHHGRLCLGITGTFFGCWSDSRLLGTDIATPHAEGLLVIQNVARDLWGDTLVPLAQWRMIADET